MSFHKRWLAIQLLLALLSLVSVTALQAQNPITISLAIEGFRRDLLQDPIAQFEAENPGIKINLVSLPPQSTFGVSNVDSFNTYLDEIATLASSADVMVVDSGQLSLASTRAGYFLDLGPLIRADMNLDTADFYEVMWQSFQWDGGFWALPLGGNLIGLVYDPAAFDAAGLSYPNETWTLADLENAIRVLSEVDASGNVTQSGILILGNGAGTVIPGLLDTPLFDTGTPDALPDFSSPQLEELLTQWAEILSLAGSAGGSTEDIPLVIGPSNFVGTIAGGAEHQFASLPGGSYGLNVSGVAVSAGTLYPEASYALAKFLTSSPAATLAFFSSLPARRSLTGVQNGGPGGPGGGPRIFGGQLSPEEQAQMVENLQKAVPVSQQLFASILDSAVNSMNTNGLTARQALDEATATLLDFQEVVLARRETAIIEVTPPPVDAPLAEGEIALKFGIQGFVEPLPNQEQWDALSESFTANDAQVGRVDYEVLGGPRNNDLTTITDSVDCFYQGSNIVPSADLSLLLPLDPLLNSDPDFDPNDMAGNVLAQMQQNGMTWGMPLHIQPQTLYYLPEAFANAGLFEPYVGWTVADFENALRALKTSPEDATPFESRGFDGTYLLTLIAAYGGLPLDYRTSPVTVNFTDPATVEAIRQVLNLVWEGYISYNDLAQTGGFVVTIAENTGNPVPMYTEQFLGGGFFRNVVVEGGNVPQYKMVGFPEGTQYKAIAYGVGGAYISAKTQYAEACYRFIKALAQQTDLLPGMPARRSRINSPELAVAQGEEAIAFYNSVDAAMQDASTITFPIASGGNVTISGESLVTYWLYRVFDRYVNDETGSLDLEKELEDAQTYALGYLECIKDIPPFEGTGGGPARFDYLSQFFECSVQVDPPTSERFPQLNN